MRWLIALLAALFAAPVDAQTIWDAGHIGTGITLSTTAAIGVDTSAGGSYKGVFATTSHSSGKYYLEEASCANNPNNNGDHITFGNSSTPINSGFDSNAFGVDNFGQGYNTTPSGTGVWQGFGNYYILSIAIDTTNKLAWFRTDHNTNWNNSGTANPATGTGGLSYTVSGAVFPLWFTFYGGNKECRSINAGGLPFVMTPPSGFSAWDSTSLSSTIHGTTPTTWNPSDKNSAIALTTGNLTATQGTVTGPRGVRTASYYTGGQLYMEFKVTNFSGATGAVGSQCFGTANSTAVLTNIPGSDFNGISACIDGYIYSNGVQYAWLFPTYVIDGDIIGVALDLDRGLIWAEDITQASGWNPSQGGTPNPSTGHLGIGIALPPVNMYLMLTEGDGASNFGTYGADVNVLNPGNCPIVGVVPTNFSKFDPSGSCVFVSGAPPGLPIGPPPLH